ISRINLATVDISLSMIEAREIFEELKRKHKIHPDIQKWQPVWEQIVLTAFREVQMILKELLLQLRRPWI
ncbi:hypothetical protein, partial [Chryseobacterium sp. SIMBA_028]|uniref:hypothetical protein n=1 Tax=Chryseobacterium sp. SIMBA_028 TaxID=3085771 RepID=UPI00397CCDEC